ncbi:methylated-DNA--cysteine S-met, partial [Russula earlei]
VYYPLTRPERDTFRTEAGKLVPPHHWAVYDLIRKIPPGKVSTYKQVCAALGEGSPRSVGGALRNNPFAPRIPCHRVIASSFSWAGSRASGRVFAVMTARRRTSEGVNWHTPFRGGGIGPIQNEKLRMLAHEGVDFGRDWKVVGWSG